MLFLSHESTVLLYVMTVRNHSRCHGDATLQHSVAACLPADACCSFQACGEEKKKDKEGGRAGRQEVCCRIR